jgi:hypothetical protein
MRVSQLVKMQRRSGLTKQPILNKYNVILAEGYRRRLESDCQFKRRAAKKVACLPEEIGAHSAPNSEITDVALTAAAQPIVYA